MGSKWPTWDLNPRWLTPCSLTISLYCPLLQLHCASTYSPSMPFVLGIKSQILQVSHNALQDLALPASLATSLYSPPVLKLFPAPGPSYAPPSLPSPSWGIPKGHLFRETCSDTETPLDSRYAESGQFSYCSYMFVKSFCSYLLSDLLIVSPSPSLQASQRQYLVCA